MPDGTKQTYEFDDNSNRKQLKVEKTGTATKTTDYLYDKSDRLTTETYKEGATVVSTKTHGYDDNGNMTSKTGGGKTITQVFDLLNRMTTYNDGTTTTAYTYNADNMRASKKVGSATATQHIWIGSEIALDMTGSNVISYIHGLKPIQSSYGWHVYDAHGDVTKLTNDSGSVTKSYSYDPYGIQTQAPDAGDQNPYRYCGEYFDKESGYTYLRARYYDPGIGRFVNSDPAKSGMNWNIYCRSNSIAFTDPSGLKEVLLRDFLEHYGGIVDWNKDTMTATGVLNKKSVDYSINDYVISFRNGRMYIDDAFLIQAFDLNNSDTYKIVNDLGSRWFATNDQAAKDQYHFIAEFARDMERAGTPLQYAQDKVMNELNKNKSNAIYCAQMLTFGERSEYLTTWAYDKNIWNYKYQAAWQVPYDYFNDGNMNEDNRKNWKQWMYFDGQLLSGDDFGNLNLAYCGVYMNLSSYVWNNFTTQDTDLDIYWMNYGETMAGAGR